MDNCRISCQVMADMENSYSDLIIINLYECRKYHHIDTYYEVKHFQAFFSQSLIAIRTPTSAYRTHAIVTRGLYIHFPIFKVHFFVLRRFFSENYVVIYGQYSTAVCNQERVKKARIRYLYISLNAQHNNNASWKVSKKIV